MDFHKTMNMHRISLDGKIIEDAIVIENGLQEYFGLDPQTIFEQAQQVPMQDPTKDIPISESGMDPIMVPGTHPGLHYRGHKLRRHKIWLQTEYKKGLKKYGYSGWQNAIASATRDVQSVPAIANVLRQLNSSWEQMLIELGLPAGSSKPFNHGIFTRYDDQNDNIGFHNDKDQDFETGSYFAVIKLGATRDFCFARNNDIIWRKAIPAGSIVLVRAAAEGAANSLIKHGVPPMKEPCGPSGSIVFRKIKTVLPWDKVLKNMKTAKRNQRSNERERRRRRKKRKKEERSKKRKKGERRERKKKEEKERRERRKKEERRERKKKERRESLQTFLRILEPDGLSVNPIPQ